MIIFGTLAAYIRSQKMMANVKHPQNERALNIINPYIVFAINIDKSLFTPILLPQLFECIWSRSIRWYWYGCIYQYCILSLYRGRIYDMILN